MYIKCPMTVVQDGIYTARTTFFEEPPAKAAAAIVQEGYPCSTTPTKPCLRVMDA